MGMNGVYDGICMFERVFLNFLGAHHFKRYGKQFFLQLSWESRLVFTGYIGWPSIWFPMDTSFEMLII
jgi:hypothetical protein